MVISPILFYLLAAVIIGLSLATILATNPVFSALYLVMTMITLAFVFFQLGASFIAGVQLIVYAGAVMVLFVMVLMLFDLKKEIHAFSSGRFSNFLKIAGAGWIGGLIAGGIYESSEMLASSPSAGEALNSPASTLELAKLLYTDYIFSFELLGLLLLFVAVGAVAVSRVKGGTHAES